MFDVKKLESDVDAEMAEEAIEEAKDKMKSKRQEIKRAERIVRNLRREYDALVLEITEDVS
jgi:hypothetical protein